MRRPTAREQRQLRRFFWSDRRGLSPAHFAINATLFLVVGVIVVADGYIVVGLLIVAFAAFCGYADGAPVAWVGRYAAKSEER